MAINEDRVGQLYIGRYHIFWIGAFLWIEDTQSGEGGSFNPEEFVAIVDKFYREKF